MGNRSGQGQAHDQVKTEAATRQSALTRWVGECWIVNLFAFPASTRVIGWNTQILFIPLRTNPNPKFQTYKTLVLLTSLFHNLSNVITYNKIFLHIVFFLWNL